MGKRFGTAVALCRYCVKVKSPGLVECGYCDGFRNPNRKANRQARKLPRHVEDHGAVRHAA